TPEDAVVALVDATAKSNTGELRAIFGPDGDKVIQSGDPVMDQRNREVFLVAYGERGSLIEDGPSRRVLYIGNEDWPFPIPLVQDGQTWRFETAAGAQEILARRIGRNELSTIKVCQVLRQAGRLLWATGRLRNPAPPRPIRRGRSRARLSPTPGPGRGRPGPL